MDRYQLSRGHFGPFDGGVLETFRSVDDKVGAIFEDNRRVGIFIGIR